MRRDIGVELKELGLHGMVGAWADLMAQGEESTASSKWLIAHLLQAEHTDRAMRSVSHQMHAAKFPAHRDLAGIVTQGKRVRFYSSVDLLNALEKEKRDGRVGQYSIGADTPGAPCAHAGPRQSQSPHPACIAQQLHLHPLLQAQGRVVRSHLCNPFQKLIALHFRFESTHCRKTIHVAL